MMAPTRATTIREPSYDLPAQVSPPHTVRVRLSFYWTFLFFPPCSFAASLAADRRTIQRGGVELELWERWNSFSFSLSTLCPERKIEKNNLGHFVKGGAGMTPPYLFVIILGDNLASPICCWVQISVVTRYSHSTQGVLIRHFIRPGATSKFFPPFL